MPVGRNSVRSPANSPLFDPTPVRGAHRIYAGGVGSYTLPPFHAAGLVNAPVTSPGYPVREPVTVRSSKVTVRSNPTGTTVTFDVRLNGVTVSTHSVSAVGLTTFAENIAVTDFDVITLVVTGVGSGTLSDLLIRLLVEPATVVGCIPDVMGSPLWESSGGRPLMVYNATEGYYWADRPHTSTAGRLHWPTTTTGNQSIEITVANFGLTDLGGPSYWDRSQLDDVYLLCRYVDTGTFILFNVQKYTDPTDGPLYTWYIDGEDNAIGEIYYADHYPYHPYSQRGDLLWTWGTGPFTMRLESDTDGAIRAYINDTLMHEGVVVGQSAGASGVAIWSSNQYYPTIGDVGSLEPGVPHISDICIMGDAATPRTLPSPPPLPPPSPPPTEPPTTPPPAPPPSGTSGFTMPVGNQYHLRQVVADDFDAYPNIALGSFPAATGGRWGGYTPGTPDTTHHGRYDSPRTISVTNGVLDIWIHTESGVHYVAAPWPVVPGKARCNLTYGKVEFAFRSTVATGYKTAWLFWPDSRNGITDGEIDFPEGDLDGVATIHGFMHRQDAIVSGDQDARNSGVVYANNVWHKGALVWMPGLCEFWLDDVKIGTSITARVPNTPMHFVLQTETELTFSTPPPDASQGHVQLDWVAVWQYDATVT